MLGQWGYHYSSTFFFFFFSKKLHKIIPVKMFYNAMSSQNMKTKCKFKQKPHQNKIPKRFFGKFSFSHFWKTYWFLCQYSTINCKDCLLLPKINRYLWNFLLLKTRKVKCQVAPKVFYFEIEFNLNINPCNTLCGTKEKFIRLCNSASIQET